MRFGRLYISALLIWSITVIVPTHSDSIDIRGTVKDSTTGLPLSGAIVVLAKNMLADTTDTDGTFQLSDSSVGIRTKTQIPIGPALLSVGGDNRIEFISLKPQRIRVTAFNLEGKTVAVVYDGVIPAGHFIASSPVLSSGYYMYVIEAGGIRYSIPFIVSQEVKSKTISHNVIEGTSDNTVSGKVSHASRGVFNDTITASVAGYYPKRVALSESIISGLEIECRKHEKMGGMAFIPSKDESYNHGSETGNMAYPVHRVTLTYDFWIDTTEVTQADYVAFMETNPSWFTSDMNRPVEYLTWFDAVLYCNARSKRDGKDTVYTYTSVSGTPGNLCSGLGELSVDFSKSGYRLPTEAEWEYACRGGTTTDYYWGDAYDSLTVSRYAWFDINRDNGAGQTTQPVGQKLPNSYGLYDMCGNVMEWCNDNFSIYTFDPVIDPTGPMSGTNKVVRGGSFKHIIPALKSGNRGFNYHGYYNNYGGFRVALPVK